MNFLSLAFIVLLGVPLLSLGAPTSPKGQKFARRNYDSSKRAEDYSVLILGGGVSGVIAARQLAAAGIKDFLIVEARGELGGRLQSTTIGGKDGGQAYTIENGANWVQGTFEGDSPVNPIYQLALKHNLSTTVNDWDDIMTYDHTGAVDYIETLKQSDAAWTSLMAGAGERAQTSLADLTVQSGYAMTGWRSKSPQAAVCEYFQFDWEYGNTPSQSAWIASSLNENFTYSPDNGGFGGDDLMSIDQRGFKHMLQAESEEFLDPSQVLYNSVVTNIAYSTSGVSVTLQGGRKITAKKALVTFSLGVLQHDDVTWEPKLPNWKQEAIHSMSMSTYTKIFLQFPSHFWFPTEMALYADPIKRGKHPVWQSLDHAKYLPDSHILFVTVTGDYSEYFEALTPEAAQEEVMDVLRLMYPNTTIPDPVDFHYPKWRSDPLFRGSYSNWPPSFYTQHLDNLRAVLSNTVYFAGEALSSKYYGFLHGAYYEGLHAGDAIAQCLHGNSCSYASESSEPTSSSCHDYISPKSSWMKSKY